MRERCLFLGLVTVLLSACAFGTEDDFATNERPYDDDYFDASVDSSLDASDAGEGDTLIEGETSGDADADTVSEGPCAPFEKEELGPCGQCGTEVRECLEDGSFGEPYCDTEGACAPGTVDSEACGACGTRTRTCGESCEWGAWSSCEGEGVCMPGEIENGVDNDRCIRWVCADTCEWGPSELKPGAACNWNAGKTWQCCGSSKWQWCLNTCQWSTDCASCSGCSSTCK